LLADAADALDFLNARQHRIGGPCVGVQHGNVKPSNLLLVGDSLKVADFGLSPVLLARPDARSRAGTLAYRAPETSRGRPSSQTDQYALAVVYCKLRSGRLPFNNRPSSRDLGSLRSQVDLSMLLEVERPIVAKALRTVPQDRWPCCREFAERLIQELARACRVLGPGPAFVRRCQSVRFQDANKSAVTTLQVGSVDHRTVARLQSGRQPVLNRDVSLWELQRCLQEARRSGRAYLRSLPKAVAEDLADWFQAHSHPCEISYQGSEGFDITVLPSTE
jgi:serine/threonine protein kinase